MAKKGVTQCFQAFWAINLENQSEVKNYIPQMFLEFRVLAQSWWSDKACLKGWPNWATLNFSTWKFQAQYLSSLLVKWIPNFEEHLQIKQESRHFNKKKKEGKTKSNAIVGEKGDLVSCSSHHLGKTWFFKMLSQSIIIFYETFRKSSKEYLQIKRSKFVGFFPL